MKIFGNKKTTGFEEAIDRVADDLKTKDLDSEEFTKRLTQLERLTELQSNNESSGVSPDTLVIVGANLLGILIIVGYEHGHVLATKGLSFILKTKHQ